MERFWEKQSFRREWKTPQETSTSGLESEHDLLTLEKSWARMLNRTAVHKLRNLSSVYRIGLSEFRVLCNVQPIQRYTDSLSRICRNTFQPLCCQQRHSTLWQTSQEKMVFMYLTIEFSRPKSVWTSAIQLCDCKLPRMTSCKAIS